MSLPLQDLIADAVALADPDAYFSGGRAWTMEGGRSCPVGWSDCSQPVFVDRVVGEYDYGDPGGPGDSWCRCNCRHGMVAPEPFW